MVATSSVIPQEGNVTVLPDNLNISSPELVDLALDFQTLTRLTIECCVVVFAISANSFSLYLIARLKSLRYYKATPFVASLLVADLLVGVVMVMMLGRDFMKVKPFFNPEDPGFCNALDWLIYFCISTSGFSTCNVALDRLICITKPLQYNRLLSNKHVAIGIASVWICSVALTVMAVMRDPKDPPTETPCSRPLRPQSVMFVCIFVVPPAVLVGYNLSIFYSTVTQKPGSSTSNTSAINRMNEWEKSMKIEEFPKTPKDDLDASGKPKKHVTIGRPYVHTKYYDWVVSVLGRSVDTGASILCQADIDRLKTVMAMEHADMHEPSGTELRPPPPEKSTPASLDNVSIQSPFPELKSILKKRTSVHTWDTTELFGSEFAAGSYKTDDVQSNYTDAPWNISQYKKSESVPSDDSDSSVGRIKKHKPPDKSCYERNLKIWCPHLPAATLGKMKTYLVLMLPLAVFVSLRLPIAFDILTKSSTRIEVTVWLACLTACLDPFFYFFGNEIFIGIIKVFIRTKLFNKQRKPKKKKGLSIHKSSSVELIRKKQVKKLQEAERKKHVPVRRGSSLMMKRQLLRKSNHVRRSRSSLGSSHSLPVDLVRGQHPNPNLTHEEKEEQERLRIMLLRELQLFSNKKETKRTRYTTVDMASISSSNTSSEQSSLRGSFIQEVTTHVKPKTGK